MGIFGAGLKILGAACSRLRAGHDFDTLLLAGFVVQLLAGAPLDVGQQAASLRIQELVSVIDN